MNGGMIASARHGATGFTAPPGPASFRSLPCERPEHLWEPCVQR
jgi:hypothetical protein